MKFVRLEEGIHIGLSRLTCFALFQCSSSTVGRGGTAEAHQEGSAMVLVRAPALESPRK